MSRSEASLTWTETELDAVLQELAEAAPGLIAEAAAADRELGKWDDTEETLSSEPVGVAVARLAQASVRRRVGVETAGALRLAARELVSWWADLATHAVLAAARGGAVEAAWAAAAEPGRFFGPELLARLPAVDEHDRAMVGLGVRMGAAPAGQVDDLFARTKKRAGRAGLFVLRRPDGSVEVGEDGTTEGRRCRLWGDLWVDHRLPDLPSERDLAEALAAGGVPAAVIAEIGAVAAAFDRLRVAAARRDELAAGDEWGSPAEFDEYDALCDQLDTASQVLARYAEALTRSLPAVRVARAAVPVSSAIQDSADEDPR